MVRECRPPEREPASSWLVRRSTMATSTRASASSPANISPVGPPPAITTAWFFIVMATTLPHDRGLAAIPRLWHKTEVERDGSRAPLLVVALAALAAAPTMGIFSESSDVGQVGRHGAVKLDDAKGAYLVSGSGADMWHDRDAFHFVWKKWSSDLALAADIAWVGQSAQPHRKACLVIRQTLDADSPYVDVAVHGDGLTSLQYRETKGGPTREIQSNVSAPARVAIEKRGAYVSMLVAPAGQPLKPA